VQKSPTNTHALGMVGCCLQRHLLWSGDWGVGGGGGAALELLLVKHVSQMHLALLRSTQDAWCARCWV